MNDSIRSKITDIVKTSANNSDITALSLQDALDGYVTLDDIEERKLELDFLKGNITLDEYLLLIKKGEHHA